MRPGVAAPASRTRLLHIGTRIGVGRSLRMLTAAWWRERTQRT